MVQLETPFSFPAHEVPLRGRPRAKEDVVQSPKPYVAQLAGTAGLMGLTSMTLGHLKR